MTKVETGPAVIDLNGKRILVAEDDYLLATDICRDLRELGATVLGPAPTSFYALSLLGRRGVDGAVLDIKLHGKDVFEVAEELWMRRIPMIFATAKEAEEIPPKFRHAPRLGKPFDRGELVAMVRTILEAEIVPRVEPMTPPERKRVPAGSWEERLALSVARSMRLP